ncbi:MAG TPA: hypothetical protein VGE52_04465 [Pirellulales bacterium]
MDEVDLADLRRDARKASDDTHTRFGYPFSTAAGAVRELVWMKQRDAFSSAILAADLAATARAIVRQSEGGRPTHTVDDAIFSHEQVAQTALLRDALGNPFRNSTLRAEWLSATVVAIAETIRNNRDHRLLPILGDALEEAGCSDDEFLSHCRNPGEHIAGCWVVSSILEQRVKV